MTRKIEQVIGIIGGVLVTLFLGTITIVSNQVNTKNFTKDYYPIFKQFLGNVNTLKGVEILKTLGAWFGFTVIIVLLLIALATFFVKNNRRPKIAGILYVLAGLVTLFGSQLIAYPLAFIFFVAAALSFFRKEKMEIV